MFGLFLLKDIMHNAAIDTFVDAFGENTNLVLLDIYLGIIG